jgi:hypothetical protein
MPKGLLVVAIVGLMGWVVVCLVRGIASFLMSARRGLDETGELPTASQLQQNALMFDRIKYQALALIAVAVLVAIGK